MNTGQPSELGDSGERHGMFRYLAFGALIVFAICCAIVVNGIVQRVLSHTAGTPLPPPVLNPNPPGFSGLPAPQIVDIPSYSEATPLTSEDGGTIFQAGNKIFSAPCFEDQWMYFGACDGNFYCIEKKAGKLRWKHEQLLRVDSSPVLIGDVVVFAKSDDELVALQRKTGQLVWQLSIPGCGYQSPIIDSGNVMIAGTDQCVVVDLEAGTIVERYPFQGEGGAIAATRESIFVVVRTDIEINDYTGSGQLLCFERGAKEPRWTIELGGDCFGSVVCDDTRCFVGDRSGQFLGIEQSDGNIAWRFDCRPLFDDPEHVWADRGVVMDGNNILFSVHHQNMGAPAATTSLNKETGEKNWSVTSSQLMGDTIAKTGSSVVAVTEDRTLVFMDASTGDLKFVGAIPERHLGREFAGVFANDESVYVVGGDQRVWRFNASLASD